jgi:hypothetical protein
MSKALRRRYASLVVERRVCAAAASRYVHTPTTMHEHKTTIASPPDREKLVAMIDFGDEQWAEINQESGKLQLELYARRDGRPWKFPLADAIRAIESAKGLLLKHE